MSCYHHHPDGNYLDSVTGREIESPDPYITFDGSRLKNIESRGKKEELVNMFYCMALGFLILFSVLGLVAFFMHLTTK